MLADSKDGATGPLRDLISWQSSGQDSPSSSLFVSLLTHFLGQFPVGGPCTPFSLNLLLLPHKL